MSETKKAYYVVFPRKEWSRIRLCTFGFQETGELDFEDMRRRLGDPDVCVWISYDKYMNLNQTV